MPKLTRRASKDLEKLPPNLVEKAKETIRRLDAEPSLGKKLVGNYSGRRSARLGRSHRIIYEVQDTGVVVLFVIPRKDAYR